MTTAEQFVYKLIELGYHVSCAESCTGGKLTAALVDVADASKVLDASIVTYANEAKMHYLGVSKDTLDTFGAVSEETAYADSCKIEHVISDESFKKLKDFISQ